MKEHIQKHRKKYTLLVFLVFAAILIFLVLVGLAIFSSPEKPKGKLTLSFSDKSIDSEESTFLIMSAKNIGDLPLTGEFKVIADDPSSVTISYPAPELLKFQLLPGESIERRINITAVSKAYRTDYKLTALLEGDNTTFADKDIILTVKNK